MGSQESQSTVDIVVDSDIELHSYYNFPLFNVIQCMCTHVYIRKSFRFGDINTYFCKFIRKSSVKEFYIQHFMTRCLLRHSSTKEGTPKAY